MVENKNYFIDLIHSSKAYKFTSYYHYSKQGFSKAQVNLGIFKKENKLLVGVCQFGISAQEKINLSRYVKENIDKTEYLELNRFCMADSEPKNSESQAISLAIKWIKQNLPNIKLLVSYAGRKEGNYGYIYQATNWEYLGYFISSGFWQLDGQEKHQITVWYHYNKYGNKSLSFTNGVCDLYHDVRRTWTKQFIYIQRLDKKLTPASEILPYPKENNEYPICIKEKIYKQDENFLKSLKDKNKINDSPPHYYYIKEKTLFNKKYNKNENYVKTQIAIYNYSGVFIESFLQKTKLIEKYSDLTTSGIDRALKNNKPYKGYYFRKFLQEEIPPEQILDLFYIAEIDNIYFTKQSDIALYLGVSRQAISQSMQRRSKKIKESEIKWLV